MNWQHAYVANLQAVVDTVHFPGYQFEVKVSDSERCYIRAVFLAPCAKTGEPCEQYTRKWYVSRESTRSEIVQTCLKCVLTSVEHEARENFTYRGRTIFAPHYDVDTLYRVCGEQDAR